MLRKIFSKVSGRSEQQIMNDQLRSAAIKGKVRRVRKLLKDGAEVDYKDVNKLTPLYFAASHGFADVARALLEHGADPNVAREDSLGPPLVQAAYHSHMDVLKLLVEHKADINAINYSQRTGLHEAVWRNQPDPAFLLLKAGADPNTRDRLGGTPLSDAIGFDYRKIALKLIQHGADVTVTDKYGDDMRKKALNKGWTEVVEAIDRRQREDEENRRRAAEDAERQKNRLAAEIAQAPVLQNEVVVKKPPAFKARL